MLKKQGHGLSAVLLAAGASSRMVGGHKLLLPYRNKTILETTLLALQAIPFDEIVVVLGAQRAKLRQLLSSYQVTLVDNLDFDLGMGHSLASGIAATSTDASGYLVALADMPLVKSSTIASLCDTFTSSGSAGMVVPTYGGKKGHPVIFAQKFRDELKALRGDVGAKGILIKYQVDLVLKEVNDPGIQRDIDLRQDYEAVRERSEDGTEA